MKRTAMLILAATIAGLAPAIAQSGEVDFSAPILDLDKKPFTDCLRWGDVPAGAQPRCEQLVDMTLGRLAATALNTPEQNMTPQEIVKRGQLAIKTHAGGKVAVTAADIETIKAAIAKRGYPPVAVVSAFALLDPASVK